jgi:hypothetical protein
VTLSSSLFTKVSFKSTFEIENSQRRKFCCQQRHLKEFEANSEGNLEGRVPKIFGNITEVSARLPE